MSYQPNSSTRRSFKILNSDQTSVLIIDAEVELLLLACIDNLHQIVNFSLHKVEIDNGYVESANSIYKDLWQNFIDYRQTPQNLYIKNEEANYSNLSGLRLREA